MNWAAIVWLVLMLAFLVAEGVCAFHLVSIWFAAGALIAMVAAWLGGPVWLQALLFFLVSGVLLILLWPIVRKFINPKHTATNLDSIIGAIGLVTETIDNVSACGQVKLGGMDWSARSTDGQPIEKGTQIRVDRIEGVKVFVTPVAVLASNQL